MAKPIVAGGVGCIFELEEREGRFREEREGRDEESEIILSFKIFVKWLFATRQSHSRGKIKQNLGFYCSPQ